MIKKILYRPFFIKLFNWEYWPFHIVYGPLFFYWFWLCIKARSFFFFNTSNPGITNGGFMMESKKSIYDLLSPQYYPTTLLFQKGIDKDELLITIRINNLRFPLIGKPDVGMKGIAVTKLYNETELIEYAKTSKVDFLVQEFISYEKEAGIFYYRIPGETKGYISGIVLKEFLEIEGDGKSTMIALLQQDKRFILQLPALRKMYGKKLLNILPAGKKEILVPYGNHARGAKFIDASHLVDEQLIAAIDNVCSKIKGFYYGRLDIRYNSWEELREGKKFSIIEVNGAGSEPTHIYDPSHSIFFAWKEIIRHWNLLYKISTINHRDKKLPYMKMRSGVEMFRQNQLYIKMMTS